MKICVFGQGTGGNAAIWFDLFNNRLAEYPAVEKLVYVCRTPCTLSADFPVITPYGSGNIPSPIYRLYAPFVSRYGLRYQVRQLFRKHAFDVLHLQGNYTPSLNLRLMDEINCPCVLNLFGSDFLRKYLLNEFSPNEHRDFEEVIERVDHVTCNWYTTHREFLSSFPRASEKSSMFTWGVGPQWRVPGRSLQGWPSAEKVFLSTRALHDYNNVDIVVEAFCRAFVDRPSYKLFVLGGYGDQVDVVDRVTRIISKYGAGDQVIMRLGHWVAGEELMALYDRADYNFCFGSSDQLSISIVYAMLKGAVNILSPLRNYFDLREAGYSALQIVPEISVESLEKHLLEGLGIDDNAVARDAVRAAQEFDMSTTFRKYLELYRAINPVAAVDRV